jgi:putative heme degradation protein
MRAAAVISSSIATLLAFAWLINKPAYDSAVAFAAAVATLLASFFLKREPGAPSQTQNISKSSVGIQAGRDANVQDINR